MYSRLNVIVKDINALEVSKIYSGSINRKILMLRLKPKYNIINAMLKKENLDTMEVGEVVGEIRAHEMGILGMSEEPTTSKSIALKTKANKHRKLKMVKQESSSRWSSKNQAQAMKKMIIMKAHPMLKMMENLLS